MEFKAQAEHGAGIMTAAAKIVGGFVLAATLLGAALATCGEILTRRIIIDTVEMDKELKNRDMIPRDLNLRIVEKIEYIRSTVRSEQLLEQKAVTRVDDISFKAEGFDFSVIKLVAPVKAAFGYSDTHVTGTLTCYRFGCGLEPEAEEKFGVKDAVEDTLRLRLLVVIQGPGGTKTFPTRISINTGNFRRELDGEMLTAAEAVMEQTDPVTVASFYYLLSKEALSPYVVERNRGRATATAQLAYRLRPANLCWASSLLATIAVAENDLVGADGRIAGVPLTTRAADPTCDAQLSLTKGLVNKGMLNWRGARHFTAQETTGWLNEARRNFLLAAGTLGAAPETRSDALIEAARVMAGQRPHAPDDAVNILAQAADCGNVSYLVGTRCDLAAKLLREAAMHERAADRLDSALNLNWRAIQADPGNAVSYAALGDILLDRAMNPGKDDHPLRDVAEAGDLMHQALNSGSDTEKVGILIKIAEINTAQGDMPEAARNLSNVFYALDRSLFQPKSTLTAERAFSLWLFILRRDAGKLCFVRHAGLSEMKSGARSLFAVQSEKAFCVGDTEDAWPLTATFEVHCGAMNGIALARCLRDRGRAYETAMAAKSRR